MITVQIPFGGTTLFPKSSQISFAVAVLMVISGLAGFERTVRAQDWQEPAWYMGKAKSKQWRQQNSIAARQAMSASNPSNQQSQLLKEYVHWYVSQLFHDLDNPIRDVVDRLLGEINRSSVSSNVRNVMMDEILAISANLVNHPDPQIRTDTMVLVIQLSSVPYSIGGGVDVPIPYLGMIDFLVEQLENDQQLLEVKILSARGLARVCRDGAPSSIQKSKIATAFVGQLQAIPPGKEDDRWWYRYRLIEGLGYVDRLDDVGGKPIVI
ncbi:MAG: hypothetical protein KDA80_24210, partial [Planctomycetaceae bacterium]|nr:hypothetical protein [Planctomycetaceae bacterium]